MNRRATDVDRELRIKATAALRRDLSARMAGRQVNRGWTTAHPALVEPAPRTARLWLRVVIYAAFAVAIALPWLLLLADQWAH